MTTTTTTTGSEATEPAFDPDRDLAFTRLIAAPRARIWEAWADPRQLEQWWVPEPATCRVEALELRPGGSFRTLMSEDGVDFVPHLDACFLAIDEGRRIVFTNTLVGGWRPADDPFLRMTATLEFREHADGTEYVATVRHAHGADRDEHDRLGFADGWGTVAAQLASYLAR
jgi:uncharacterized protein YndB with AHSA1/START domain